MKPVDIVTLVRSTWENTIETKRLAQLQAIRATLDAEHLELFDSLVDMQISNVKDDAQAITLMLVHGIQTDGVCTKTMEKIQGVWKAGTGYQ